MRGQAAIYMAIVLAALVGFVGMAADGGMLYVMKGRLQNSVDAAALAGAQGLPSTVHAGALACTYINANPVSGMTGAQCSGKADVVITDSNTKIRVTAYRNVSPVLLPVFGIGATNVRATAAVMIGSVGNNCVFPAFLQASQVVSPFTLLVLRTGAKIDVGSGADAVKAAMQPGGCNAQGAMDIGDTVDLQAGATASVLSGWHDRLLNVATSSCPSGDVVGNYRVEVAPGQYQLLSSLTLNNCPRLVIVPVLPTGTYSGNEDDLPIQGFAALWIRDVCEPDHCVDTYGGGPQLNKGDAWVYFVPLEMISATYTTFNAYGTKIVVMTE
jgi:Flp pilus assembly protein TadG